MTRLPTAKRVLPGKSKARSKINKHEAMDAGKNNLNEGKGEAIQDSGQRKRYHVPQSFIRFQS